MVKRKKSAPKKGKSSTQSLRDKYKKLTKQRSSQRRKDSQGSKTISWNKDYFNPDVDSVTDFDVLPYKVKEKTHPEEINPGDLWWRRPYQQHRNIGPEKETVICPKSVGKPCPICEERAVLAQDWDENKDAIKALNTSDRDLILVRPHNDNKKVKLLDQAYFNFGKKLDEEIDFGKEEYQGFWLPDDEGYTLSVRWAKKQFGDSKPFPEASRVDFEERDKALPGKLVKEAEEIDLAELLKIKSYNELQALFHGQDPEEEGSDPDDYEADEDEEEMEEEEVEEEDDEEEEEDEEEEDEEEDEDDEEDDEDDEEDDEDDEEEEEPVKPSRRKSTQRAKAKPKPKPKPKPKKKTREKAKSNKMTCEFGHEFGVDCEDYEDCDTCDLWGYCAEEKEKNT